MGKSLLLIGRENGAEVLARLIVGGGYLVGLIGVGFALLCWRTGPDDVGD